MYINKHKGVLGKRPTITSQCIILIYVYIDILKLLVCNIHIKQKNKTAYVNTDKGVLGKRPIRLSWCIILMYVNIDILKL